MKEFILTQEETERTVLVGLITNTQNEAKANEYLNELAFLAETAGALPVKKFLQRLDTPNSRTFVGSGKLSEIKAYIEENEIGMVIFDDDLSSKQVQNIERELQVKILDRTSLILDIFAKRAQTANAKRQVELAQYQYLLPRLTRLWTHLERQRGGIGMRGPGETQIETDRRIILDKISHLKEELKSIDRQKSIQRKNRGKLVRVALVGYTNVGKSTLMNLLSKSEVFAENKLFATLDTTVRKVIVDNLPFLLSDTVGFIRKLPHNLIEAFKSTLEEAKYADIIVHVVDASSPDRDIQMDVVYKTLKELEVGDKPVVTLFNKCDKFENGDTEAPVLRDFKADETAYISARTGRGIADFEAILEKIIRESRVHLVQTFAYADAGKIQQIRAQGQLIKEEYTENGIEVEAYVPKALYQKLQ